MGLVPIQSAGPMSGVMAPPDVFRAGASEWARVSGIDAADPLVGGGQGFSYDVDSSKSRIVTGTMGPDPASRQFDDWRDIMNWRDSPIFWIMLASIVALGLIQLSLSAKVGPARASASIG